LKGIKIAMTVSTSWCIIAFFLLYFVPAPFIQIFSNDSELIEMASSASRQIFLVMYLMGLVFTGSMIFVAVGKAKQAFITSITQRALFLVPLVFILPPVLGIDGVWLSFPVSDGLSFILTLALLIPVWRQFKRLGDQSQESLEIPEKSSELTMSEIGET
jgi:Na+-driven multidrug efflux pump